MFLRQCARVQKAKIHPSLLDPTLYVDRGIMRTVVQALRDAQEAGVIPHAPSPAAISKALARRGPEARQGIQASFKAVKKVFDSFAATVSRDR